MATSRNFLNNLQAVRAYAALSVILVHLLPLYGFSSPVGHYGVDLFFVLSGFLMALIAATDPSDFLIRRLIRIVPVYWLCTAGVFLIARLSPEVLHSTKADWGNLVKSLLFIPYRKESGLMQPMLNPGWTLNYEMFFYAVFALALRLKLPKPSLFVALSVAVLPAVAWLRPLSGDILQFYSSPIVLDFVLGIGVYHLLSRFDAETGSVRLGLAGLLGCLILLPCLEAVWGLQNRELLLGLPAVLIIFLAVRLERKGWSVTNRLLLLVGDASYSLYLTHLYVLQTGEKMFGLGQPTSIAAKTVLGIFLVVLAILLACALRLLFEVPLVRILRRILLAEDSPPKSKHGSEGAPVVRHDRGVLAGGHSPGVLGVLWAQYGPYHIARIAALKRRAGHGKVHALELASQTSDYEWSRSAAAVDLITLCPGAVAERLSFWEVFRRARQTFAELKLEVCLLPSYAPKQSLAALMAAKSLGIRTVMMNESHAGTARARGIAAWVKRGLVGLFDAALVGGSPQKRYFASQMPPEKIFIGYDAVDNDYFGRRAEEVRKQKAEPGSRHDLPQHYFLSLGRFVRKKNLATLIRAYRKFLDSGRVCQTHLVMVGSGEEEERLKALCQELRLPVYDKSRTKAGGGLQSETRHAKDSAAPPGVHFYGFRQIEENPVFYALADAFILPSLWEEWGLVVNEAMASGLPVIVSETAGCAEDLLPPGWPALPDGLIPELPRQWAQTGCRIRQNGFLFNPNSFDSLAKALLVLAAAPALREIMGRASRRIVENFSCDAFARNALLAARTAKGESAPSLRAASASEQPVGATSGLAP
jgi:peptidoglycan/LPS O-acetylase OafA/YrhL/glycosyltransferase involved in cell wall biosynthesis